MSGDVLVRVEGVSKKFCKSLKRSLWYGVQDIASELNPFARGAVDSALADGALVDGGLLTNERTNTQTHILPPLRRDEFWAVRDVSFELRRGECLGLIGHNGAGKSTLLKMLNGIIKPNTGRIEMCGRICAMIELGAGFNPVLTGRENIYNRGAVMGFTKKEIDDKYDAIVDFAEIGDFLEMPIQNYSSGMKVRLGFAVSVFMEPDVLIIDEVLAVGDLSFRIKCYNMLADRLKNAAVVLVSHSMQHISKICTEVMLMSSGQSIYHGKEISQGIEVYMGLSRDEAEKIDGAENFKTLEITINGEPYTEPRSISPAAPFCVDFLLNKFIDLNEFDIRLVIWNQNQLAVAEFAPESTIVQSVPGGKIMHIVFATDSLHLNFGNHFINLGIGNPLTGQTVYRHSGASILNMQYSMNSFAGYLVPAKLEVT